MFRVSWCLISFSSFSSTRKLVALHLESSLITMRKSVDFVFIFGVLVLGAVSSTERRESIHRLPKRSKRVINGQIATPHEFPWQVSIRKRRNNGHICGGCLISHNLVLTAAHCIVVNPCLTKYSVVLGAHFRKGKTIFQQHRKVKRWHAHSSFTLRHYRKDIALLWLDRPVKFNRAVHAIWLPPPRSRVPVGSYCLMSGWGRTTRQHHKYSNVLRKTLLPIIRYQSCAQRNNRLFKVDDNSMFCAGGRGRSGGCRGDSGGPLACRERRRWVLRGIVSWGEDNCRTDYYTVFTRVSSLINWIRLTAKKGRKLADSMK